MNCKSFASHSHDLLAGVSCITMTCILPIVTLNFDGRVVLHSLCFDSATLLKYQYICHH